MIAERPSFAYGFSRGPLPPEVAIPHFTSPTLKPDQVFGQSDIRIIAQLGDKRGHRSEGRIAKALRKLPMVTRITRCNQDQLKDTPLLADRDMEVEFVEDFPIRKVWIQSKSAPKREKMFRIELRDRLTKQKAKESPEGAAVEPATSEDVHEYLMKNFIVVLDGGDGDIDQRIRNGSQRVARRGRTEAQIKESFIRQVEAIIEYHHQYSEAQVDIGLLAFSGTATAGDAAEWIKQNPR
jgi:hypothetical protein